MKKFLVLYCMPAKGMKEWMKLPEEERKSAQDTMKADWDLWMNNHKDMVLETSGAGKNQRVTKEGVGGVANDVMLFSTVQAESEEQVSTLFKQHPHLDIPGAYIEIMPANYLPGME